MNNPYERREIMKKLAQGRATQEDIDALEGDADKQANESPIETFSREQISDWGVYEGVYQGQSRKYLAPGNGIWLSGKDVLVEEAYRVVGENQDEVRARRVQGSEESAVVHICKQGMIKRILDK